MKIKNLKLLNFRNYENINLDFSDGYNIIYGNNGSGKTNLVEGIYVLALTKSFRGSVDKVLIMNNKDIARVEGTIQDEYEDKYKIIIKDSGKRVKINDNKIDKLSDYISRISVILFNPDDLRLIKDTPSVRRNGLNIDISQINNTYLKLLNMYNKLLKQRNMYLKTTNINGNSSSEYLDILTKKIIDYGEKIYSYRKNFINQINELIPIIYRDISAIEGMKIIYKSDYNDVEIDDMVKKYKDNLQKDIILGKTTIGVHHDDIKFMLGDLDLKDYGSEGQQKNAVIAYKLAELEIFKKVKGSYPILILDDLFSELDRLKINNILKLINDDIQTFITTTEIDKIDKNILDKSRVYKVEDSVVREDKE